MTEMVMVPEREIHGCAYWADLNIQSGSDQSRKHDFFTAERSGPIHVSENGP